MSRIKKIFNFTTEPEYKKFQGNVMEVLKTVRQRDREFSLLAAPLPVRYRVLHFTLRAFHDEITSITEKTSIDRTAQMRLDWWEDAISSTLRGRRHPDVPVLNLLSSRPPDLNFRSSLLYDYIETARLDNENLRIQSLVELAELCSRYQGSLLKILLDAQNLSTESTDQVCDYLGAAIGYVNIIRSTQKLASSGKVYIPNEVLTKAGLTRKQAKEGKDSPEMRNAIFEMTNYANAQLEFARDFADRVPKKAFPTFLCSMIPQYAIEQLENVDFNIESPKLRNKGWRLSYLILKNRWLERY